MKNTNAEKYRNDSLQATIYDILPEGDWGLPLPEIETIEPEEIETAESDRLADETGRKGSNYPGRAESD